MSIANIALLGDKGVGLTKTTAGTLISQITKKVGKGDTQNNYACATFSLATQKHIIFTKGHFHHSTLVHVNKTIVVTHHTAWIDLFRVILHKRPTNETMQSFGCDTNVSKA